MIEPSVTGEPSDWPLHRRMETLSESLVALALASNEEPLQALRDVALVDAARILSCLTMARADAGGNRQEIYLELNQCRAWVRSLSAVLRMIALATPDALRKRWEALGGEADALITELTPLLRAYAPPPDDDDLTHDAEPTALN